MENKVIINLDEYMLMKEQLKLCQNRLAIIDRFITKNYRYESSRMFYDESKNISSLSIPGEQLDKFVNELAGTEGVPVDVTRNCIG